MSPLKYVFFPCKVELDNFSVFFPRVGADEYKNSLFHVRFSSVVFLLKFKNYAVKWDLFFNVFL